MARISLEEARRIANDPRMRTYLDSISHAEGTYRHGKNSYKVQFGGGLGTGFQRRAFETKGGKKQTSDAYGRYQFLGRTWEDLKRRGYDLDINNPLDQDAAAVILMADKNAIKPILEGNFAEGDGKLNGVWASLPGSPYDQPTKSVKQREMWFKEHGANYKGGSGVDYKDIAVKNVNSAYGMNPAGSALIGGYPDADTMFGASPTADTVNALQLAIENGFPEGNGLGGSGSIETPRYNTPEQKKEYKANETAIAKLTDGTVLIPANKIEEKLLEEVNNSVYSNEGKDNIAKAIAFARNLEPKFDSENYLKATPDTLVHSTFKRLF